MKPKRRRPQRPRADHVKLRLHMVYFAMMPPSPEGAIVAGYQRIIHELRQARIAKKMTQEELDERLGLTRGHVEKLENRTRIARADTLMLWADGLGFALTIAPPTRTESATLPK